MGIRKYKATTNGRRNMNGYDFAEITKTTLLVVTAMVTLLFVTVVVVQSVNTVLLTLSELKMMFQQLLRQLNTIQIVLQILLYLFTLMVLNHTSSHLRA